MKPWRKPFLSGCLVALAFVAATPARAARESRQQKDAATRQFREYVLRVSRLPLAVGPGARGSVGEAEAKLRPLHAFLAPRLMPSERKAFDAGFAALMADLPRAERAKANEAVARHLADVYRAFKVFSSPAQTPDPALGREIYETQCATCHGPGGGGDGKLASSPVFKTAAPPTRFDEAAFTARMSPFLVYNALMLGVPDTVMPAYQDQLSDHELWSVSFFVAAMPYGGVAAKTGAPGQKGGANPPADCLAAVGNLRTLSRGADGALATLPLPKSCDVAFLRTTLPFMPALPRE